ncbi:MAG: hypothetical protein ACYC92_14825 [Candidatus Acidiferrales bacterium]
MAAVSQLATTAGIQAACQALALPRASFYCKLHPRSWPSRSSRRRPARALDPQEKATVLACLHEERFQDRSPAAVYATLLDEGRYHGSIRTMYRVLDEHGESRPWSVTYILRCSIARSAWRRAARRRRAGLLVAGAASRRRKFDSRGLGGRG